MTTERKKLIEVALPLEAINVASAREKSIRHGHPSTLHLWWARRPLAACRAILFASLVDDPSSDPDRFPTDKEQEDERGRLFGILERLVLWENTTNETVLDEARAEIRRSTGGNPPPLLDPFCGGGSIPLEAERLGLTAYASDLNPVAVLITKALIEIPPKFRNLPPVHPDARRGLGSTGAWRGASGLAEDVRRYGAWMRDEGKNRIGGLYPKIHLPKEQGGGQATVVAWLWTRTVICPNPACGAWMPLVRSFELSSKKGGEAWIEPIVDRTTKAVRFDVRTGRGTPPDGSVNRQGARCIVCESPVPFDHIRAEGRAKRMDARLMAVVAEGQRGRIYVTPTDEHEAIARSAEPDWAPGTDLPEQALGFRVQAYGMTKHRDLFTSRQLIALTTFSDLVGEARARVHRDAVATGLPDDAMPLHSGGTNAPAYADAVATYLGLGVSRLADILSSLSVWSPGRDQQKTTFARQALAMVWDYAEANPFSGAAGDLEITLGSIGRVIDALPATGRSISRQADATSATNGVTEPIVSTDPPYYDNIGYADLSDFFYVWLRRALSDVHPELFGTLLTPKSAELIATPFRFGGDRAAADKHFETGLGSAFSRIAAVASPDVPVTVFYAFKQAESDEEAEGAGAVTASTGWETMLEGLLRSGLSIRGTWPMRTERISRSVSIGTNALASSIVLVCRQRSPDAPQATRREFAVALRHQLPEAIILLQRANIAPVDLAQASIGPGMAIFSRYAEVLEANGARMGVRRALEMINAELDVVLRAQEGDLDVETRWCTAWFETHGFDSVPYGAAETLATAKDVSVRGLEDEGLLTARAGKVQLRAPDAYDAAWDPRAFASVTIWRCTHQLIRTLGDARGGVEGAAGLVVRIGSGQAEVAKELAYRLYGIADRKRWSALAGSYNQLVTDWPQITEAAERIRATGSQSDLGL